MTNKAVAALKSIEGVLSELAAANDNPQGYPFSKVIIYYADPEITIFKDYLNVTAAKVEWRPADNLQGMRSLDFKRAGKILGSRTQEAKNAIASNGDTSWIPAELITVRKTIPESAGRLAANGLAMIEVELEECKDYWMVIKFRKAVKQYITEELGWDIVPPIFKGTDDVTTKTIPRVYVGLRKCSEDLYQALEKYGKREFARYPIRLHIPSREWIADNLDEMVKGIKVGDALVQITQQPLPLT